MIKKILIANRGEIAVRIIKTAKKLGIVSVAIYSDIDRKALFVELADEAYSLAGTTSQETYLNINKILAIAKLSNCDAIHPGYGFLSENAEFADSVNASGIKFIGPSAQAILQMGMKSTAKKIMQAAGVPVLPGYNEDAVDDKVLLSEAKKMGYPILIKAAAGGGGKGMRIVANEKELPEAIAGAKREALKSFANDKIILEKYLEQPRHIEVQILADTHGNNVYLFERDCSMQRRYQKVIEEAPAPNIDEALRKKLGLAALKAAQAINYHGVGTIEFLLDGQDFYFMEMNTRLQVEHPVTEMVTGLDLVELQILVANGKALPFTQKDLAINGVAIEVRLYAEDTQHDFLPACGTIDYLEIAANENIRIDTGFRSGDVVDVYYDPMLAKVIAWGADRKTAINRLLATLQNSYLLGVKNNISFLAHCLQHKEFVDAKLSTNFIALHAESLRTTINVPHEVELMAGIYQDFYSADGKQNYKFQAINQEIWSQRRNFRLNQENIFQSTLQLKSIDNQVIDQKTSSAVIDCRAYNSQTHCYDLVIDAKNNIYNFNNVCFDSEKSELTANYNNIAHTCKVIQTANQITLLYQGHAYTFDVNNLAAAREHSAQGGALNAPMPGTVIAINVNAGSKVLAGDILIILEAMKMEHAIKAPREGIITNVNFKQGEQVAEGAELLIME